MRDSKRKNRRDPWSPIFWIDMIHRRKRIAMTDNGRDLKENYYADSFESRYNEQKENKNEVLHNNTSFSNMVIANKLDD